MTVVISESSPFAPVDIDEDVSMAIEASEVDESPLKEVEGMNLVSQVVHPDCRPILEFGTVTFPDLLRKIVILFSIYTENGHRA